MLQTADRNDIQFSVPHSHSPFGQSYREYNEHLESWLRNFHGEGIAAVNFGYILIHRLPLTEDSSYYRRTIHSPQVPIHDQVAGYFEQRARLLNADLGKFYVQVEPGIAFREEYSVEGPDRRIELFYKDNPYYTAYVVSEEVLRALKAIALGNILWSDVKKENNDWLLDLICKGILRLSKTAGTRAVVPDRRRWRREGIVARPLIVEAEAEVTPSSLNLSASPPAIQEIQTETTPTCLSSYL